MKTNKANNQILNNNEELQFSGAAFAQQKMERIIKKEKRLVVAFILAAIAMLIIINASKLSQNPIIDKLSVVVLIGSLICTYVMCGFKSVLKVWKNIAFWGWYVTPFPIDLIVVAMSFSISLILLIFLPLLFVVIEYVNNKKEKTEVEQYLAACK